MGFIGLKSTILLGLFVTNFFRPPSWISTRKQIIFVTLMKLRKYELLFLLDDDISVHQKMNDY